MKIIKTSEDIQFEEFQALMFGDDTESLSEAVNLDAINLVSWVIADDMNNNGSYTRVLVMRDSDGKAYATISTSFITEFINLVDGCRAFGRELASVRIVDGVSKSGQSYLTCKMGAARTV